MPTYIVNKNAQPNGDHEVHRTDTCTRLPEPANRVPLGNHATCLTAVTAAKQIYPRSNGCYWCSPECNTG